MGHDRRYVVHFEGRKREGEKGGGGRGEVGGDVGTSLKAFDFSGSYAA